MLKQLRCFEKSPVRMHYAEFREKKLLLRCARRL